MKAYLYLLCESWLEVPRATLPTDDTELAAMANVPIDEWIKHKQTVMSSFILSDNRYVNEKLLAISEEQARKSSINRENGKKGGNPAFEKGKHNPYYNPEDKRQDKRQDNRKISPATATATAITTEASKEEEQLLTKKSKIPTEEEFLASLKASPAYAHVNVPVELSKIDTWLLAHPGRKKTRRFVVNWLNRIEAPLSTNGTKTESIGDSWINYKKQHETKNLH